MAYRLRQQRQNPSDFVISVHSNPDPRFVDINPTHRGNDFALGEASAIFIDRIDLVSRPARMGDAHWFCNLLVVLRDNNLECREAVSLLTALAILSNQEFEDQIVRELRSQGVIVDEVSFEAWVADNVLSSDPVAADEWAMKLRAPHYVMAYCLTMLLIGKYLDTNNYSQWFLGRKRSFTNALGLSSNDDFITWFRINMTTCQHQSV